MTTLARAGIIRPRWWFAAAAALALGLGIGVTTALGFVTGSYPLVISLAGSVAMLTGRIFRQTFLLPKKNASDAEKGSLELDATTLRWENNVVLERADVRQAFIIPRPEKRVIVRIEKKSKLTPPLHLEFDREEDARALVSALGVDAQSVAAEMNVLNISKTPTSLTGQIVIVALALVLIAAMMAFFFTGTSLSMLGAMSNVFITVWLAALFVKWFATPRVRIGVDGVLARSWLQRQELIRFSNVQRARIYDLRASGTTQYGVLLSLIDGTTVRFATGPQKDEADRLLHRIEEARSSGSPTAQALASALIPTNHEGIKEWLRTLKQLGARAAGSVDHRTAAITPDALLSVVENAGASETKRAGAALAALSNPDTHEDAKRRVRIAAETTASPTLRVALQTIADEPENEDEVEKAVKKLSSL